MEKNIFDSIAKNNINELKVNLAAYNGGVDFTDDNGEHSF